MWGRDEKRTSCSLSISRNGVFCQKLSKLQGAKRDLDLNSFCSSNLQSVAVRSWLIDAVRFLFPLPSSSCRVFFSSSFSLVQFCVVLQTENYVKDEKKGFLNGIRLSSDNRNK